MANSCEQLEPIIKYVWGNHGPCVKLRIALIAIEMILISAAEFHGWSEVILIGISMDVNFPVMAKKLPKQFFLIFLVT